MKSDHAPDEPTRSRQLPDALRCPSTGKPLEMEPGGAWVRVVGEAMRYPVRNGIPILVPGADRPTVE